MNCMDDELVYTKGSRITYFNAQNCYNSQRQIVGLAVSRVIALISYIFGINWTNIGISEGFLQLKNDSKLEVGKKNIKSCLIR